MSSNKEEEEEEGGGGGGSLMSLNHQFHLQPCNKRKRAPKVKYPNPNCKHPNILCAAKRDKDRRQLVKGGLVAETVPVDDLVHKKYVALFFVKLKNDNPLPYLQPLIRVYHAFMEKHPAHFEIVFIAHFPPNSDDEQQLQLQLDGDDDLTRPKQHHRALFELHLSRMPWPALPFDDRSKWRHHIASRYQDGWGFDHDFEFMSIFDPSGSCLQEDSLEDLLLYGPDFFPFTEVTVTNLQSEYKKTTVLLQPFSIKNLLISSKRDYLIAGGSSKLSISRLGLQRKAVGLFFYHGFRFSITEESHRKFMDRLHSYHILSEGKFQVIFINLEFDRGFQSSDSLLAYLQKYDWLLALPFEDDRIRALAYTFDRDINVSPINRLVILANDVIEPYGYDIIEEYGLEAYPFTRDRVIELKMNNLAHKFNLSDVFETVGATFLAQSGTPEARHISFLQNKRVVLFLDCPCGLEIEKLQALEKKDKSFSIVVLANEKKRDYTTALSTMPKNWLFFHTTKSVYNLKLFLFGDYMTFNESGNFLRMGELKAVPTNADFPFISHEIFTEIFRTKFIYEKEWFAELAGGTDSYVSY